MVTLHIAWTGGTKVQYVLKRKYSANSLMGKLVQMLKQIDLYSCGEQKISTRRNASRQLAVYFYHRSHMMHFEFEGFGDLLGQEITVYSRGSWQASNFIGIDNDVCLHYQDPLPLSGLAITITSPLKPNIKS